MHAINRQNSQQTQPAPAEGPDGRARPRQPFGRRTLSVLLAAVVGVLSALVAIAAPAAALGNGAMRTGLTNTVFPANDDGSVQVALPFTLNFFGTNYSSLYLNNNGNLTFDGPLGTFTPFNLASNGTKIIAPFFADVDTATTNSQPVLYGPGTVDGHQAWAANWPGVGCYNTSNGGLNNFQVVLINRSDVGTGDFDIEFNYDRISWDSGQASNGNANCQNGSSARAGYSDGTSANSFELPGSAVPGAFLDSSTSTNLIGHSRNSTQLGRYVFPVRSGAPVDIPPPSVAVTGVSDGATYSYAAVPAAGCAVTDSRDGTQTVSPTLSAVTGPRADVGLGSQTATCTYTNSGGILGTAHATYTIADQVPPAVTVPTSPLAVEATSSAGAPVTYEASATDAIDGPLTPTCSPASGTTFGFGDTTVTCAATDTAGNTAQSTFTVHVQDTTAPAITAPSVTTTATSAAGAVVDYTATTSDAVDGPGAADCTPASGTTFPLGDTTVTCTATDHAGNTSHATLTVTVQDRTAPVVHAPDNITAEATGPAGAAVSWDAPSATDDVDGTLSATCIPASGSTLALGETTVTCTATDHSGNVGSASFAVTVHDTTPPVVHVPDNITREAASSLGSAVSFDPPTATDAVTTSPPVSCDHASGGTFPLGTTTVTCTATDTAGNIGTASFTVTVHDTTPPTLTVAGNQVAEATSPHGAAVNYDPATAVDAVDGTVAASCSPASGTTFALGDTTVTCTATDAAGNIGTKSFTVTVHDTTAPSLAMPANQVVSATGPSGATVRFDAPTATDAGDGSPQISCDHASGDIFPLGTSTVTCTATDHSGNAAHASFTITVQDVTKPVVTVPANISTEASSPAGTTVYWSGVSATDDVDGPLPATCDQTNGGTFPLGVTHVTCSATDNSGNVGTLGFTITVTDTTAPTLTVPDNITATATSPAGAAVSFPAPTATDLVDGTDPASCDKASGSTFGLGVTTVTCTSTDAHGNLATKTFTVDVTYAFGGFADPVVAGRTYKLGSTIPVKFTLTGASAGITNAAAKLYVAQVGTGSATAEITATASGAANTGNTFRYDGGQYIFNWSTKGLAAGAWHVRAELGDGTVHDVVIQLR